LAITEQAWSKSGEISSLMTATRKGELMGSAGTVWAGRTRERPEVMAAALVAARKVRRERLDIRVLL
jgi:hypothetical protein